jgi:hypothetical protein
MAASDDILDDYRKLHTQMLDDIRRWRGNGWRLRKDDEDITERWLLPAAPGRRSGEDHAGPREAGCPAYRTGASDPATVRNSVST